MNTPDTGAFWFFHPGNLELFLKALDACSINGHYWLFVSGLTDVEVDLRVGHRDTVVHYHKPLGVPFETFADVEAFPCE